MIKKILDWILGKNDSGSTAHPLDGATRAAEAKAAPYKIEPPVGVSDSSATQSASTVGDETHAKIISVVKEEVKPVVEAKPVTVKAKFKKADLNKMTKKELLDLAGQHGVEVKARAPKDELVKLLVKV